MRRALAVLACLVAVCSATIADGAYQLDAVADSIMGAAAIGIAVPSLFIDGSTGAEQPYEEINRVDQSVMYDYSETLDDVSTAGAYMALLVPGVLALGKIADFGVLLTYGVMYGEAFLLTMGTKDLLKAAVSRNRPYTYLGPIPGEEQDDYFNSFPSGHTAFAFLGATFLTTTLLEEYPGAIWNVPAICLGYALAAGIGTVRVLSGNHFVTDVVAGALIGSLFGWLVPRMHGGDTNGVAVSISQRPDGITLGVSYTSVEMSAKRVRTR